MKGQPPIRPTVRVLLIDEMKRVLLFRGQDPDKPTTRFWFPPGGGIEEGESAEDAARREIFEETGLKDFNLGPHVWNRRHVFTFYGKEQDVREVWFLSRVPHFEVDTSRFTEVEKEVLREYRWWELAELETTEDFLTPRALATLLPELLHIGPPFMPKEVGV
jgi:8-oxo-dGTP pyrophosphatase MutT (NUDIX family)